MWYSKNTDRGKWYLEYPGKEDEMARYNNPQFEYAMDALAEYIDQNELHAEDALPSERKLSQILGVSRGTVREAINRMCMEGRLYTVHGKGSFLAGEKEDIDMKNMISFSGSVLEQKRQPGSRQISLQVEKGGESEAKYLQIDPGEELYVLTRVRTVNGKNLLLEISHIPVRYCPGLEKFSFEKRSLYDTLEKVYKIKMERQDITVRLSKAAKLEARYLDIGYEDPVFVEKAVAYSEENIPVEYTKTIVIASRAKYTIEIGSASA